MSEPLTVTDVVLNGGNDVLFFSGPRKGAVGHGMTKLLEITGQVNDTVIYGVLGDNILDRQIEMAISPHGTKTMPGRWKNHKTTVRDWLTVLSEHKEGSKDGNCWTQGPVINGDRKAQAVPFLDWICLDLDTGESIAEMRAKLMKLGLFAIIYSTHSSGKDITEVKKDAVVKLVSKGDPDAGDVAHFLMQEKRYQPWVLQGAEIVKTEHTDKGVMIFLRHQPMEKFRVCLLLKERFVIADRTGTQKDVVAEWKERYAGVSKMLGAFFDRACTDPSRLFHLPRHPKGAAKYSIDAIAGEPLDLDAMPRVTAEELREEAMDPMQRIAREMNASSGGEAKTPGLKAFLFKSAKRFEICDFINEIAPDTERGSMTSGSGSVFMCPNDEAHTNAGDSEDKGFFAINASDTEGGGFVAKCHHDGCADVDRMMMLDKLCVEHGIVDAEELRKWCFREEGEPEYEDVAADGELKPYDTFNEARAAVSMAVSADFTNASLIANRIGRTDLRGGQVEELLKSLSKRTGVGMRALAKDFKDGENASAKDRIDGGGDLDAELIAELQKWNEKYAVLAIGSKVKVLVEPPNLGQSPQILDVDSFRILKANKIVGAIGPDNKMHKVPLSKLWFEWPERREHTGLVFEPSWSDFEVQSKGVYNIWKGWPVTGVEGDWSKLRSHMFENICQGNDEYFEWLMTWFAHMFQHPGAKLGSAVAIRGAKGTGKSKLFDMVREAMGVHAAKVSQKGHIVGNFNAHQESLVLLVCEEAFWAGDIQAGGALKDLITSPNMMLERKGLDASPVSNYARLAMISNEDWVVPASLEDERRFFVLECGQGKRGDTKFFAEIEQQMMVDGGLNAMVAEFMSWQTKDGKWDTLRNPPMTPWLQAQARSSLEVWDRFFIQMATDGGVPATERDLLESVKSIELSDEGPTSVPVKDMRHFFEKFITRTTHGRMKLGDGAFLDKLVMKYLNAAEYNTVETDGEERYLIPGLIEIRKHLMNKNLTFREVRR